MAGVTELSEAPHPLSQPVSRSISRLTERHFLGRTVGETGKFSQPDCAVCSRKKGRARKTTSYMCKQCALPMCPVPCFELYHTKVDPVRYL